jgi:hypothetical protein
MRRTLLVVVTAMSAVCSMVTPASAAAQWSPLVELTPANFSNVVATAVNDSGDAVAAFRRWADGDDTQHFYVSVRPHGHGWSTPKQLSAPRLDAAAGDVGIDSDGTVTAVWQWVTYYPDGVSPKAVGAQLATKRLGHAWSDPVNATGSRHYFNGIAIDVAATGRAVLSWLSEEPAGIRATLRTRNRHGVWHAPRDVSPAPANGKRAFLPGAAISNHGYVTAAWIFGAGASHDVLQRVSMSPTGHLGTRVTVDTGLSVSIVSLQLAGSVTGGAVLGWSRYRHGRFQALATFRRPGHAWQATQVLVGSDYLINGIQVATSGDRAVVAWSAGIDSSGNVETADATFAPGRGWSRDASLATGWVEEPIDVAITAHGRVFRSWLELKTADSDFAGHLASITDAGEHELAGFGTFDLAVLGMAPHGNLAVLLRELAQAEPAGVSVRTRT